MTIILTNDGGIDAPGIARSDFEYAIAGTPADCVRVPVSHITENVKYVIFGINAVGTGFRSSIFPGVT